MQPGLRYRTEEHTVSLPAADYIARFRDARRIEACCRRCPSYGHSWACPPFDFDIGTYLSGYATALLVVTKIYPAESGLLLNESLRIRSLPHRIRTFRFQTVVGHQRPHTPLPDTRKRILPQCSNSKMERIKAVFNWSGGKDSAHALWRALSSEQYEILALLTTINRSTHRSTMHDIPLGLLQAQRNVVHGRTMC